jgi:hypothetical protein
LMIYIKALEKPHGQKQASLFLAVIAFSSHF